MLTLTALATAADAANSGLSKRIFGGVLVILGLLAIGISLYLRFRPGRMSAKPYRSPVSPYGHHPGAPPGGDPPTAL